MEIPRRITALACSGFLMVGCTSSRLEQNVPIPTGPGVSKCQKLTADKSDLVTQMHVKDTPILECPDGIEVFTTNESGTNQYNGGSRIGILSPEGLLLRDMPIGTRRFLVTNNPKRYLTVVFDGQVEQAYLTLSTT